MFVKPARGGSSIGVSRVTEAAGLPAAIAEARRHDPKVIIEAAVSGRELECGLLEFPDGAVCASTIGEIRVAVGGRDCDAAGFYDFATKYLDDAAELDVPAHVDDLTEKLLQDLAIRTFNALDCQGLARVDFFLTEDGPVVNEINTMPGFTTISMYPRMWGASGVDYQTLVGTMVDTALARGTGLR
jgi:D-alanine-D-alanine ligase